jgi:hypothetical protein
MFAVLAQEQTTLPARDAGLFAGELMGLASFVCCLTSEARNRSLPLRAYRGKAAALLRYYLPSCTLSPLDCGFAR